MGHRHPRYNAKARQSSVLQQKRKKHKSSEAPEAQATADDSNLLLMDAEVSNNVKQRHREELDQLLAEQYQESAVSKKKRKRLENYIHRKLEKEDHVQLIQRLSQSSFTSELMRSSKTLGSGKGTLKQRLKRSLLEERAGLPVSDPNLVLKKTVDVDERTLGSALRKPAAQSIGGALKRAAEEHDSELSSGSEESDIESASELQGEVNEEAKEPTPEEVPASDLTITSVKDHEHGTTAKESQTAMETPEPPVDIQDPAKKACFVIPERKAEIQAARLQLPILAEEHAIMELIKENLVVVLCGETGSGKTTQLPQFLLEYGFGHPDGAFPGRIGITQPRRVAAISMAHRVGIELGMPELVGYQVCPV